MIAVVLLNQLQALRGHGASGLIGVISQEADGTYWSAVKIVQGREPEYLGSGDIVQCAKLLKRHAE